MPVVLTRLGDAASLPLFLLLAFHSMPLFTTITLVLEIGGAGRERLRDVPAKALGGLVRNPILWGLAGGIALNLLGLRLPAALARWTELVAGAAVPCALFSTGASLRSYRIAGALQPALVMVALKLVVCPLAVGASPPWYSRCRRSGPRWRSCPRGDAGRGQRLPVRRALPRRRGGERDRGAPVQHPLARDPLARARSGSTPARLNPGFSPGHGRPPISIPIIACNATITPMPPASNLPGRVARYARIATVLGRFMARLAGERYLGGRADGAALARELTDALGRLRGPVVKVGQLLATVPGALPAEYVAELMTLQAQAPAMGPTFVRRRMAGELGPDWQSRFRAFDLDACRGVVGQVHRAIATDGRLLACKLQYPDMDVAVDADLRGLDLALRVLQQYQQALTMGSVRAELEARLREELDYELEARHMTLYRDILQGEPAITVPEPVQGLSTRRLLTMTWLEGEPIQSRVDCASAERSELAITMFRACMCRSSNTACCTATRISATTRCVQTAA